MMAHRSFSVGFSLSFDVNGPGGDPAEEVLVQTYTIVYSTM